MSLKLVETVRVEPKDVCSPPPGDRDLQTGFYRGGYAEHPKWSGWIIELFNRALAFFLILACLPLFVAIGLAVKWKVGGAIFYRGTRMGLGKKPFYMYKFRTLPMGTQRDLGSAMVSEKKLALGPFVRLLRDTRLDELPQLFNILTGDMDFVGPRPMRPEIYEAVCGSIPNFDLRFSVRPGLIGFSQLFTPHSTPKRLRAIIDNRFILIKRKFYWDIFIVFYTGAVLLKAIVVKSSMIFYRCIIQEKILKIYREKRRFERMTPENSSIFFVCPRKEAEGGSIVSRLIDINEAFCKIDTNCGLDNAEFQFYIMRRLKAKNKRGFKRKKAQCVGVIYKEFINEADVLKYSYVIEYKAISPFNNYIIEKYFLRKSII